MREIPLDALLAVFTPGEETTWEDEWRVIETVDSDYTLLLMSDIQRNGIQKPILLGNDGRVWDGHHRLWCAYALSMPTVPAEFSGGQK